MSGHPYDGLTPEVILDAVESAGLKPDGRLMALNSFENRVYQLGVGEGEQVVVKFYRPGRWTDEAILEEHAFTAELADHEIPTVAPLAPGGKTLHAHGGFRFALFSRQPGRTPELEDEETLAWIGRLMGRIHAVGRTRPFSKRPALNLHSFGENPLSFIIEGGFLPSYLGDTYTSVVKEVFLRVERAYLSAGIPAREPFGIRLHGDCHPGNMLWTDKGPHFVDFDDCRTGPAIQDLWMLLSGERDERQTKLLAVMDGYLQFCDFDHRELKIIEALRALRMVHHSGWLARRFDDPAFKASFPWFNTPRYWEEQILALREQAAIMDEPVLELE